MTHTAKGDRTLNGQWICAKIDCDTAIDEHDLVWLGEHEPEPFAVPMHRWCAEGPWPLYEVTSDQVKQPA